MKNSLICSLFIVVTFSCGFCSSANADLVGDVVVARWQFPATGFDVIDEFLVVAGPEGVWPSTSPTAELDISSSSISVDYFDFFPGQTAGTIWTFSSLDWQGEPRNLVDVNVETNWDGWDESFVSFGDDFLEVNFANDVFFDGANDSWVANLEFASVPEPSSAVLLIFVFCAFRRKSK